MVTRLLATALVLAGCVTAPPGKGPVVEPVAGQPQVVRLFLDRDEAFNLSRAGIMDPSSPSGITDQFRYRAAIEGYVAAALGPRGLCAKGYERLEMRPARAPFHTEITVTCLPA